MLDNTKEIKRLLPWEFSEGFQSVLDLFSHSHRRHWQRNGRFYFELRNVKNSLFPKYAKGVVGKLKSHNKIAWAGTYPSLGLAVAEIKGKGLRKKSLLKKIDQLEKELGISEEPFFTEQQEHPADSTPLRRLGLEIGADSFSMLISFFHRLFLRKPLPLEVDLAALLALMENSPQLRQNLEKKYPPATVDLALNLSNSVAQGLAQGPLGPAVDIVKRLLLVRERLARKASWEKQEDQIAENHFSNLQAIERPPRPVPLPQGPIEEYANKAWYASWGAFGLGAVTTHSLHKAAGALTGGLPKPALLGREAFVSQVSQVLGQLGVQMIDSEALRRLDRVNCLIIDGRWLEPQGAYPAQFFYSGRQGHHEVHRQFQKLFDAQGTHQTIRKNHWSLSPFKKSLKLPNKIRKEAKQASKNPELFLMLRHHNRIRALIEIHPLSSQEIQNFLAAVKKAKLSLYIVTSKPKAFSKIKFAKFISPDKALDREIRRLQRRRKVVALVASGKNPGFLSADLGIGILRAGSDFPWGAHLVVSGAIREVTFLIDACRAAQQTTAWSVNLSYAAASVGFLLSAQGLKRQTSGQVMAAVNAASLFAMGFGVWTASKLRIPPTPTLEPEVPWHELAPVEVLKRLKTSRRGLSDREAKKRYIPPPQKPSPAAVMYNIFLQEIRNPLTPVLSAGAALSAIVGSLTDASLVMTVVGLNALIGGLERYKTEEAVHELGKVSLKTVRVTRGGREKKINPKELVPGDILHVHTGYIIPADCRILESNGLEVDESSLTGESIPVKKSSKPVQAQHLADRLSMLYEGTTVNSGEAMAVVVAVGEKMESQRAYFFQSHAHASGVEDRLEKITEFSLPITLVSGAALVSSGLMRGKSLPEVLSMGVSLSVAAIPEGLPIMATMAQLAAARRLSKEGILAQNIRAIEGLGRVNVICLDKTGTLTHSHIQLEMVSDGKKQEPLNKLSTEFKSILQIALRATPQPKKGRNLPHMTDRALREGAEKIKLNQSRKNGRTKESDELRFAPSRNFHAVRYGKNGQKWIALKGSPEVLLEKCSKFQVGKKTQNLTKKRREDLFKRARSLAREGRRILAIAEKRHTIRGKLLDRHIKELTFRGFLGLSDPLRETALEAVENIQKAGVEVVMVTGDHPSTAERIAASLNLMKGKKVMTGEELDRKSDRQLEKEVQRISVFARVTPSHKVRIVQALQKTGSHVAMTGDGTNDAAAIRMADVGIAVSEKATPAARKAADIVITNNRIESIAEVVTEGRGLWTSVRDAVAILVGGNMGEIAFTLLTGLFSNDPPLSARQLLLVNLLTDVAPALAIASQRPPDRDPEALLKEGPELSLGAPLKEDIAWRSLLTAASSFGAWIGARLTGTAVRAKTVSLLALVGSQLGQTLLAGGPSKKIIGTAGASWLALAGIVQTPGLSGFFDCRPVGPVGWTLATSSAVTSSLASLVLPKLFPELPKKIIQIKMPDFMKDLGKRLTGSEEAEST